MKEDRQVGVRLQRNCTGTHQHGRVGAKAREQKKKARVAKSVRGTVHGNDKNDGTDHVQDDVEKLVHHDEQALLSVWQGWDWDDTEGGWLDPELCAKARREEVEYIRHQKMHTRVPRETCLRGTEKAPIKTEWVETDEGQPGKLSVRARRVAKKYRTHARPELHALTPLLEAVESRTFRGSHG